MSEEPQTESKTQPEESTASAVAVRGERMPAELAQEKAETGLDFVLDVPLKLRVEVGHAKMLVRDVLQLGKGAVVELDRMNGDPADVLVNDRLVARGEITVVDERVAVRIVEVVTVEGLGNKLA